MNTYLKALLSDSGSVSTMRVMSLTCCLAGIVIAFVGVNKASPDYSGLSMLVGTFLSMSFGGKVMQKRVEASGAKSDAEIDAK